MRKLSLLAPLPHNLADMVALLVFTIKLSVVNANAFFVFQLLKKLIDSVFVLAREQVSEFGGFFH